jgi:hypothetical protein
MTFGKSDIFLPLRGTGQALNVGVGERQASCPATRSPGAAGGRGPARQRLGIRHLPGSSLRVSASIGSRKGVTVRRKLVTFSGLAAALSGLLFWRKKRSQSSSP